LADFTQFDDLQLHPFSYKWHNSVLPDGWAVPVLSFMGMSLVMCLKIHHQVRVTLVSFNVFSVFYNFVYNFLRSFLWFHSPGFYSFPHRPSTYFLRCMFKPLSFMMLIQIALCF
jgi:hypothetical protein